jgi:hypothetical protein
MMVCGARPGHCLLLASCTLFFIKKSVKNKLQQQQEAKLMTITKREGVISHQSAKNQCAHLRANLV